MNINRDFENQSDELTDAMINDMEDELEGVLLQERISFLYEVVGGLLMNAKELDEEDGQPTVERTIKF